MSPNALLLIDVEALEGLNRLKQKIIEIKKSVNILNASSAYKRKRLAQNGKEYFEVVIQIEGLTTSADYFELAKRAGAELLAVEGELKLDPALTLPNPKLQLDAFVLHLAAECAPYWEHRVRKKTLLELDKESIVEEPVEFLTQGQALITL
jgi:7,8-dihydro-6-hydroxymethylpterin-pyrophosphokinase